MDRRRLNVLYVSRGYSTHDRRFLGSFVSAGWEPTHLPMLGERLDSRPLPAGVKSLPWGDDRWPSTRADWLRRIGRLKSLIAETKPDVVIAGPVQHGALIAALADAWPLVTVSWGSDMLVDANRAELCRHATRRTLHSSALVFGDCRAVNQAVEEFGGPPTVSFPWGIDLDRYKPGPSGLDVRQGLGWEENLVFISTRTWEPLYAIDVLLKAFAGLQASRIPEARLFLLGDGSMNHDVHALVDQLGIAKFVHAPGRVGQSELPDWFRAADAYVSSALSDGTSISMLEAMATGLPVVVSECFGNLEWVHRGVNGALAHPGDVNSLTDAMEFIASDRERATRMGSGNIELARSKANWDNNFPELVNAIERIVG